MLTKKPLIFVTGVTAILSLAGCADPRQSAAPGDTLSSQPSVAVSASATSASLDGRTLESSAPNSDREPAETTWIGPDFKDRDFWEIMGAVAVEPVYNPDGLQALVDFSSVVVDGTIIGLSEHPEGVSNMIVASVRAGDTGEIYQVAMSFPNTNVDLETLRSKVPTDRGLWFLAQSPGAVGNFFGCTNTYLCVFVDSGQGPRAALDPETDYRALWADMSEIDNLDELQRAVRSMQP